VDTLSVTLGPGEVVKHFSALDLATRFSLAQVHGRATASLAARFLVELVSRAPFPIRAIQVDGGSEFMAEFETTCQRLGIRLFVLPPRSPKLNGHVERMRRTFRDEFYTRPLPSRLSELQAELEAYLNYLRVPPHSSTPAILSKTRLRMRLWTKRIRFTRAARPQKDRASIR
jgi:putative transposase